LAAFAEATAKATGRRARPPPDRDVVHLDRQARVEQQIDIERRLFGPVDAASAAEGLNEFALVHEPPEGLDEVIGVLIASGKLAPGVGAPL
jgi:hypothetical protein